MRYSLDRTHNRRLGPVFSHKGSPVVCEEVGGTCDSITLEILSTDELVIRGGCPQERGRARVGSRDFYLVHRDTPGEITIGHTLRTEIYSELDHMLAPYGETCWITIEENT